MIKFLRFRDRSPSRTEVMFMTYGSIAKFLNKSITYVRNICLQIIDTDKKSLIKKKPKE